MIHYLLADTAQNTSDKEAQKPLWPDRALLIIDFDPAGLVETGFDLDDDLAFLLYVGAPRDAILAGVTVSYGNSLLTHTSRNAANLLKIGGINKEVPRVKGADVHKTDLYGKNAAADFIVDTVANSNPGYVVVVCLGPLTNLAAAFARAPDTASRMRAVYISGPAVLPLHSTSYDEKLPGWSANAYLASALAPESGRLAAAGPEPAGLDFTMADGNATDVVMRARVPRVIIPRSTCRTPRFTWEHLLRMLDCCPGAGACEYMQRLHAEISAAASPGLLGSVLWKQRQRWAGDEKNGFDLLNDLLERQRQWEEEKEAAERGILEEYQQQSADGTSPLRGTGGGPSVQQMLEASGIPLCDLTTMLAFLEPATMGAYQVVAGIQRDGWGLREQENEHGAGARRGPELGPHALTALLQGALPDGAWQPGDPKPDQASLLGEHGGLPQGTDALREAGVAVLGYGPDPRSMELEVAGLCAQLHGQPYLEMTGAYEDEGLLNPYILYPVVAVVVPALALGLACCILVLRCTGCCGLSWCAKSRLLKAAGGARGKES